MTPDATILQFPLRHPCWECEQRAGNEEELCGLCEPCADRLIKEHGV